MEKWLHKNTKLQQNKNTSNFSLQSLSSYFGFKCKLNMDHKDQAKVLWDFLFEVSSPVPHSDVGDL